MAFIIVGFC